MGINIELIAEDSHQLTAYLCDPATSSKGGIVVLQEIFGVNDHIRTVCDRFSKAGYTTIAPALYDRSSKKNVQLSYSKTDIGLGRKLREEFDWNGTILDIQSAVKVLQESAPNIGVVGYCWGGTMAFLSATRLQIQAAVVYYGGQIMPYVKEHPTCPLMMHFGDKDLSIPKKDVQTLRDTHPQAKIYTYDADHGFNCDQRSQFNNKAATTAYTRTLHFFSSWLT